MPLPTVSRKVSDLERHLGTQLVVRTSRKLLLTDAGRAFVVSNRVVLDMLNEAERAAAGEYRAPRGDLLVTAPILFGKLHVAPIAIEFLAAYPEVNLKLVLADHVIDLAENHVDAAVRIGKLPDSALRSGTLIRVLADHSPEPVPIHLIHVRQALIPLKLRTFLDFAQSRLEARIAAVNEDR